MTVVVKELEIRFDQLNGIKIIISSQSKSPLIDIYENNRCIDSDGKHLSDCYRKELTRDDIISGKEAWYSGKCANATFDIIVYCDVIEVGYVREDEIYFTKLER